MVKRAAQPSDTAGEKTKHLKGETLRGAVSKKECDGQLPEAVVKEDDTHDYPSESTINDLHSGDGDDGVVNGGPFVTAIVVDVKKEITGSGDKDEKVVKESTL
jgi:hypothetical protein